MLAWCLVKNFSNSWTGRLLCCHVWCDRLGYERPKFKSTLGSEACWVALGSFSFPSITCFPGFLAEWINEISPVKYFICWKVLKMWLISREQCTWDAHAFSLTWKLKFFTHFCYLHFSVDLLHIYIFGIINIFKRSNMGMAWPKVYNWNSTSSCRN